MHTGTVKFFNAAKGYGFITRDDDDADVFIHVSDLLPGVDLREGDKVSFDVASSKRGLRAVNLRLSAKT
jgi:CspA family cold shock protein